MVASESRRDAREDAEGRSLSCPTDRALNCRAAADGGPKRPRLKAGPYQRSIEMRCSPVSCSALSEGMLVWKP